MRISLPLSLVLRISDLLCDIMQQKPSFEIYETAATLTKDLLKEMKNQEI